jgi:hypothetical protein
MTSYSMAKCGSASSSAFLALCHSTIRLSPSNATLIWGGGKEKKKGKGREGVKKRTGEERKDRISTRFSSQISDCPGRSQTPLNPEA